MVLAVAEVNDADGVARARLLERASQVLEAVDGLIAQADDHVAVLEARAGGGGAGEHRREPEAIGLAANVGGDAEEGAAARAAEAPCGRRGRELDIGRPRLAGQPRHDAGRDSGDLRHSRPIDLVRRVPRGVVVVVRIGEEEEDRRAGRVEGRMVRGSEGGVVEGEVESLAPGGLHDEGAKPRVRGAPPAAAKARASARTAAVPEALSSAPGCTEPPARPRWS